MVNWFKTGIIPVLLAGFVFVFSISALWLGDDILYDYSFKDGAQITSFEQVIPSQVAHYHIQNGRIPAHFLCQLFIPFFGKTAFALTNALVYVIWLLLLARLCRIRFDDWRMMGILACLLLLGFRTKFTPTCQIGFPWMFALVTVFLLVFRELGDSASNLKSGWHLLWCIPLAFLAGWSNEALVIGIGAAFAVYVLLHFKELRFSQFVVLAAFVAGAGLLCLSPASVGRVSETHASTDLLAPVLFSLAKLGFYLRISYLLFALVLYLLLTRKASVKSIVSCAGFYWIVWAVMLLFNLLIGVYGNRQLFGMEFAALIIVVKLIQSFLLPEEKKNRIAGSVILSAMALWVLAVGIANARFLKHHWEVYRTIDTAYHASDDGIVYYDFSAADVTSDDTYPSDVFTWNALETMSRAYGRPPRLTVLPNLCKHLEESAPQNRWERTAPGTIAIVIDKENPPQSVRIQRSLLGKRLSDAMVSMAEPVYENQRYKVFLVYEKMPLVTNDDVLFTD